MYPDVEKYERTTADHLLREEGEKTNYFFPFSTELGRGLVCIFWVTCQIFEKYKRNLDSSMKTSRGGSGIAVDLTKQRFLC